MTKINNMIEFFIMRKESSLVPTDAIGVKVYQTKNSVIIEITKGILLKMMSSLEVR